MYPGIEKREESRKLLNFLEFRLENIKKTSAQEQTFCLPKHSKLSL